MKTDNIFNLVHHFGNEEDQVSATFGFMMSDNKKVLLTFLENIGITNLSSKQIKNIEIETQVGYNSGESKIDLQIKLLGEFLIFIESKIKGTSLGEGQFQKYYDILEKESPFYNQTHLILITQFDRVKEFNDLKESSYSEDLLRTVNLSYFRWINIQKIIENFATNIKLKKLFLEYLGGKMADKRIISEQKIKDVGEVMIATTSEDFWKINIKKKICFQGNNTKDCQYIAFYRTSPIQSITHIGKVKYSEKNVLSSEVLEGFPDVINLAKQRGWYESKIKVYHLESVEELLQPIKKGKYSPPQVLMFKPLIKMLTAKTMEDLK